MPMESPLLSPSSSRVNDSASMNSRVRNSFRKLKRIKVQIIRLQRFKEACVEINCLLRGDVLRKDKLREKVLWIGRSAITATKEKELV